MSKAPPIPREQKSFGSGRADIEGGNAGRRDMKTGLQSTEAGDRDTNLDQQGRQANTRQNVDYVQHRVQDR